MNIIVSPRLRCVPPLRSTLYRLLDQKSLLNIQPPIRHHSSTNYTSNHNATPPQETLSELQLSTKSSDKLTNVHTMTSLLEPPTSTLPPPLSLPSRSPDTRAYSPSHLFRTGKAYVTFYRQAMRNIWQNYKSLRALRSSLSEKLQSNGSALQAASSGQLSRAEFQLWVRTQRDVSKIPLFLVVLMVCGEFTPLLVAAGVLGGSVIPRAAWIPSQVEAARKEVEARRERSFGMLKLEGSSLGGRMAKEGDGELDMSRLGREQLLHVGRSLNLYGGMWDSLGGLPEWILRRRMRRRLAYLQLDDGLIRKNGGEDLEAVTRMKAEEIKRALEERGVDVLGVSEENLTKLFVSWVRSVQRAPLEKLVLTRPYQWPHSVDLSVRPENV